MKKYEIAIIGGGLVGLATAYALLKRQSSLRLLLIEKEATVAQHQSSRNSGVIHSGIYYKPGSAKAINCSAGYKKLLDFCDKEEVPYHRSGKLIVALTNQEVAALGPLALRGKANGLQKIQLLQHKEQLQQYEPYVTGKAGLWVPQTAVVDYKKVAERILFRCKERGLQVAYHTKLISSQLLSSSIILFTSKDVYEVKHVINCAGLYADQVMRSLGTKPSFRIFPFRGEYYTLTDERNFLVKGLIYPVPDARFPFLGLHFTKRITGEVEMGPNAVLAWAREGYSKEHINWRECIDMLQFTGFYHIVKKYFNIGLKEMYRSYVRRAFLATLQNMIPSLQNQDLAPGGTGVRAQACTAQGHLLDDFYIVEEKRVVHVCNAPSPAATSCLSIGETIAKKLII